jgi:hypothetical protein
MRDIPAAREEKLRINGFTTLLSAFLKQLKGDDEFMETKKKSAMKIGISGDEKEDRDRVVHTN